MNAVAIPMPYWRRDRMSGPRIRFRMDVSKVGFCRVRTEPYPGYLPGYYPTKNFCKFCRTFIPVPRTSVSSVQLSYPYPNICEFCTPVPQNTRGTGTAFLYLPGTSVSFVRPCHNTRNFCEFCNTSVPVPGTSVTSVRLWHNTRGAGIPLLQYPGSPVFIQV